jgi:mannose-1-phosphate guanylyltransferase
VWNVRTIVNALRIYQPEVNEIFEKLLPIYGTAKEQEIINQEFPKATNISIDYAVLEKADEIFVFPASFGWSDVGTWGSLHTLAQADDKGNNAIGQNIHFYESKNCVVHTTQEHKVIIQGLDSYIVAEKDNTLLICKLEEEQRIKEFSAE